MKTAETRKRIGLAATILSLIIPENNRLENWNLETGSRTANSYDSPNPTFATTMTTGN